MAVFFNYKTGGNCGRFIPALTILRQRVWEAAHVQLKTITLDTDTTVHTLFGHQMGGRKSYNPKNRGKKSFQRMSSEGWRIQWESNPPGQKSEPCSLDSQEGRKLNPEAYRQSHPWDGERVIGP